jgi:carboxypeptidase Taq
MDSKNQGPSLFSISNRRIKRLLEINRELAFLQSAANLFSWDQHTYMPKGAGDVRAELIGTAEGAIHKCITSKTVGKLLDGLESENFQNFTDYDKALIRLFRRIYNRNIKVPKKLAVEIAEATSKGQEIWDKARAESKFSLFKETLERIVNLKFQEAKCVGYETNPYALFLDDFEPGMTTDVLDSVFESVKRATIGILKRFGDFSKSISQDILKRPVEQVKLANFSLKILEAMGFDFKYGRQDESAHPFTTSFDPTDVRITTRYGEQFLTSSIFTSMHEGGHALYEQNADPRLGRTLIAWNKSLVIHESQSRLWENLVGRSKEFWSFWYPLLAKIFLESGFKPAEEKEFVLAINKIQPDLIRVNSDEVTYNLHIILRYELERDLFGGHLDVKDLPEAWNTKIKEYLGLDVPDDKHGVLQDVHWSSGGFGYFPTYTLGNLYAAQIWPKICEDIGEIAMPGGLARNLKTIKEWLKEKIHRFGATYETVNLLKMVTGEKMNPQYFTDYINKKFENIYK